MSRRLAKDLLDYFTGMPPIRAVIRLVSEQTGFTSVTSNPDAAVFKLLYEGFEYEVVLDEHNGRARLSVASNARFPLHRIHPDVLESVMERNKHLPISDWKTVNGKHSSWLVVTAHCAIDDMDGETFMRGARGLLHEASYLDSLLRETGLL